MKGRLIEASHTCSYSEAINTAAHCLHTRSTRSAAWQGTESLYKGGNLRAVSQTGTGCFYKAGTSTLSPSRLQRAERRGRAPLAKRLGSPPRTCLHRVPRAAPEARARSLPHAALPAAAPSEWRRCREPRRARYRPGGEPGSGARVPGSRGPAPPSAEGSGRRRKMAARAHKARRPRRSGAAAPSLPCHSEPRWEATGRGRWGQPSPLLTPELLRAARQEGCALRKRGVARCARALRGSALTDSEKRGVLSTSRSLLT